MAHLVRLRASPTNWLNLSFLFIFIYLSIYLDRRYYLRGGRNCLHTMGFEVIDSRSDSVFYRSLTF